MDFLKVLFYLRRFLLETVLGLSTLTMVSFLYAPDILGLMKSYLGQDLAFYGVFEPMVSLIKISCITAVLVFSPWMAFRISQAMRAVFGLTILFSATLFFSSMFLFMLGVLFCFFVTLPFGINFLLQFGSDTVRPVIAVGKFVNFSGFFLLGFGLIFQLPLIMVMITRTGLMEPAFFQRNRRYAILVVAILAAVLTPTPDVFNMSLMGIPLYFLYEIGILFSRLHGTGHRS